MVTQEFYILFLGDHGRHPSFQIRSLIEFEDVLATTGGSELAITGGDGQVIKADHLASHQLDTPV